MTKEHLEMVSIIKWFEKTDYIPNKIICGEWDRTDERFTKYLEERLVKRARRDELEVIINQQIAARRERLAKGLPIDLNE